MWRRCKTSVNSQRYSWRTRSSFSQPLRATTRRFPMYLYGNEEVEDLKTYPRYFGGWFSLAQGFLNHKIILLCDFSHWNILQDFYWLINWNVNNLCMFFNDWHAIELLHKHLRQPLRLMKSQFESQRSLSASANKGRKTKHFRMFDQVQNYEDCC